MHQLKGLKRILIILMVIVLTLLFVACTNKGQPNQTIPAKNEKPKESDAALGPQWKLPISIPKGEGEFYKIAGWLSESEVVYITNLEQTSDVFRYNLLTGKSELIFKSENPIVTLQISPSQTYLLVHSSPSSYEGIVTIISLNGTELWKKSFPSYELVFEWNPYNESEVFVSKFDEDWSFQLFILNMKTDNLTDISLPQPFVKWINEKEVAFIDWDEDNPTLFAPLKFKGLENDFEKTVFPSATQFSAFRDLLMTISVNEEDQTLADYSFFDKEMKKLDIFSIPQLTKFSDWLIPYNDFNQEKDEFITFKPLRSGDLDSYIDGFQLETFNLKKGNSELIMEGMENKPINFSPTGDALLYGYQFEQIIDLKAKKIYDLQKH